MHKAVTLLALACGAQVSFAQLSLYLPGFDPQPLTASEVGVDSAGRTTWAIAAAPTVTDDADIGIVGTATLVEGSDYASVIDIDTIDSLTVEAACTIAGGNAVCVADDGSETATATEPVSFIQVDGAAAAATITGGSASAAVTGTSSASGGSSAGTSPSDSGSAASPSQTDSGAMGLRAFGGLSLTLGLGSVAFVAFA
ncbi:hypothetical protein PUNSTDRAFT_121251 [Punctularia strigosozonata HHB-11173 SS5]|uniref:uncharacterized protein n=1 Tax=Punctularia strigosozonata (strain HHB-11173) TaxID=741275 RepID=UPI0004417B73|nr:uncharacterized protein PUNSTDRAFT_121251 [Punctularia strigosozonata HHB-11173 SS5]EIN07015.1 hypothetical protein PUNSTDRAFT_121251 [Punctularia strigosozonata HHB-11173 SS5]